MRKNHLLPAALIIPTAMLLASCAAGSGGAAAGGESFDLKFASYNVPTAAEAITSAEWAKDIEEATDGRVTIKFFYQEALLAGAETLPGVGDGRADMGYIAGAYYPAELPLSNVAGIPFLTENVEAQARTFEELYESSDALREEWESQGVKVVTWAPVSANIVATKEPTGSLEELEGQKVRGYGYVSEALKMAGASAVGISQSEVYEALQRGVLDATSGASLDVAIDRHYEEVAPHFMDVNFGNYAITANIINLDIWESMPADIQDAITEVSSGYLDSYLENLGKLEVTACDKLLDAGGSVTILNEAKTAEWREEAGPAIRDIWANDVTASNPEADSDEFFDSYTETLERYESESSYESAMKRCAAQQ